VHASASARSPKKHGPHCAELSHVRGMEVLTISHPEQGDMIQVHFDVVAAVHYDDDRTGQRLAGSRPITPHPSPSPCRRSDSWSIASCQARSGSTHDPK